MSEKGKVGTQVWDTRRVTPIQAGTSVAVATTNTSVVGANEGRLALVLSNDSDTVIYLRLASTGATVGAGIRLAVGANFTIEYYSGAVAAIHGGTGTKNLSVAEV